MDAGTILEVAYSMGHQEGVKYMEGTDSGPSSLPRIL